MAIGRHNRALGVGLGVVIVGMVGLSFASVPLYRMFCAYTGFGGTPQIGGDQSATVSTASITVRFNADTNPNLPWSFAPAQRQITLPMGAEQVAFYTAQNEASTPVTGVAVYNVTPERVGKYFHKTACFCFNEQTLAANQRMQFPLSFWVDPAIAKDPSTSDVKVITLSYTFFRSINDAARTGALAKAGPHIGPLVR